MFDHLEPATHRRQSRGGRRFPSRAASPSRSSRKRRRALSLELDPTPDILAELGRKKGDRLLIGFAAETENLIEEARRKLETKNCDMVVANLVGSDGTGFESDENEVLLVLRTGETIPCRARPSARSPTTFSTRS